jgi:hypothetical protein
MSIRILKFSWAAAVLVTFAVAALSQESGILQRVPDLQKKAAAASSGTLGCGIGTMRLVTSQGEVTVRSGLDPIQVFGDTIQSSDLFTLLRSRSESNRSGKAGPMSGQVSTLCCVCLIALSHSKDPEAVGVIAELLTDKHDGIRGWAAVALYRLGDDSDTLQKKVTAIQFPKAAIDSAAARGVQPPSWIQRAK